ncbi:MAG: YigZ family protein [bacterium]|nr:YigZ family protein [bacterium]
MIQPDPISAKFGSPARVSAAKMVLGAYHFEALLFPVYSMEEVNEVRKRTEAQFSKADAVPYVYALPPCDRPLARFGDHREVPQTASKAMLQEIEKAKILNVLIIAARFGSGSPRPNLLLQAYAKLAQDAIATAGRAPLTRRHD